jgi:hypothetical protein
MRTQTQTHACRAPEILTRKGFHAYFAKRLAGYVCDDQAFIDWRGLRLPAYLKTGASAVRRAFPVAQL